MRRFLRTHALRLTALALAAGLAAGCASQPTAADRENGADSPRYHYMGPL